MNNLFLNPFVEIDRLKEELSELKYEVEIATDYIKTLEEKNEELESKETLYKKDYSRLRNSYKAALSKISSMRKELADAKESLEYYENKPSSLEEMLEGMVNEAVEKALVDASKSIRRKDRLHGY